MSFVWRHFLRSYVALRLRPAGVKVQYQCGQHRIGVKVTLFLGQVYLWTIRLLANYIIPPTPSSVCTTGPSATAAPWNPQIVPFLLTQKQKSSCLLKCVSLNRKSTKLSCKNSTKEFFKSFTYISVLQGGSNMTGTDLCVNKPHCAVAVPPWESEATTSILPPARVRTCSVLSGSC